MKKILFLAMMLFVFSSAQASVEIKRQLDRTIYDFNVESVLETPVVLNAQTFMRLSLTGVSPFEGVHYRLGLPEIPVIRFYVTAESENDIEVSVLENKNFSNDSKELSSYIKPSQPSLSKMKNAFAPFTWFPLQTKGAWPSRDFEVTFAGSFHGQNRYLVTLFPVHYEEASKSYTTQNEFSVSVLNPHRKSLLEKKDDAFIFVVGKNFKDSPSLERYRFFKTAQGYVVKTIVFGEEIKKDVDLRKAIQEIYNDSSLNLKYVLIIGDAEYVTPHKAQNLSSGLYTDHFYRAIDTENYELDINGPDVGLGRLTIKNEVELEKIIQKFINYQVGSFTNEDWLIKASFLATNDRYQVAEATHNYVIDNYTKKLNYQGIFPQNPMLGGDQLYAITHKAPKSAVLKSLSEGRFFIDYSGHGATTFWDAPNVTQDDVRSFNSSGAYPFVVGNACITGQFIIPESFGETWIKNSAIMYWGSMDSSLWDEDDVLERAMADKIFKLNEDEFGAITNYSLGEVWRFYNGANKSKYYWETYTTFGDPSIHLRTGPVKKLHVLGDANIPVGQSEVRFSVLDENDNFVQNARVTITQEGRLLCVQTTNTSGEVVLPLELLPAQSKLTLNVFAHNAALLQKELTVITTNTPYLLVANFQANGASSFELNPYEVINLNFLVKNVAKVPSEGGEVVLERIEGPAKILANKALIPHLGADQVFAYTGTGIRFQVLDGTLADRIVLYFSWKTVEGTTQSFKQTYALKKGELTVNSVDFGTPNNFETSSIAPGGNGSIYITVKNTGKERIMNALLTPSPSTCVSNIFGDVRIPLLYPGEEKRISLPINVTLNSACTNNQKASFVLSGKMDGLYSQLSLKSSGDFTIGNYQTFNLDKELDLDIPDLKSVEYTFDVGSISFLKDMKIAIKMVHSYPRDLVVTLFSPDGKNSVILDRQQAEGDQISLSLALPDSLELRPFIDSNPKGTWRIQFKDMSERDTGKVKSIKVFIKGFL